MPKVILVLSSRNFWSVWRCSRPGEGKLTDRAAARDGVGGAGDGMGTGGIWGGLYSRGGCSARQTGLFWYLEALKEEVVTGGGRLAAGEARSGTGGEDRAGDWRGVLLIEVRPDRVPRPWTVGDAVEAGLATEVSGASVGRPAGRGGSQTADGGAMSETIRGGKSEASAEASAVGDGDAVAEAEAVLETGVALVFLVTLPASPCAIASPVGTEDGAGAAVVVGGSSSPAEAMMVEWTA